MQIGLGLDSRLGLSTRQLLELGSLASELRFDSIWTNAGVDYDPIGLCVAWNQRTGLPTGVSVVPITRNPPAVLALAARTAVELSGGRFMLGIGSGSVTDRPIAAVREYIAAVRKGAPDVPLCVGALGPQMLRLASRQAEAAALNWCTPEQILWSREQVGPRIQLVMYIRVCVDDDVAAARRTLAQQILAYALLVRPTGARGYRAHFERMGFGRELATLEEMQAKGASQGALIGAMSDRFIDAFGYAGDGITARERVAELAQGLDVAIVRVLSARPGDEVPVHRAIAALAPAQSSLRSTAV
ncbi:MAG: LLM class flavin-dependent oxidoreductase [Candidatus Limnocylindria bacterium]|nr:LLM class flavin-dependent oxidoreductase [Candidatus Limnocylindria bacterium]